MQLILIALFFGILTIRDLVWHKIFKTMTARQDIHAQNLMDVWVYLHKQNMKEIIEEEDE